MGKRTSIPLKSQDFRLENFIFQTWFCFAECLKKPLKLWLAYRILKGKEDKNRISERWGVSQKTKKVFKTPHYPILWFHAASVGETASILDIAAYLSRKKSYNILLTTATLSAKELIVKFLTNNPDVAFFHQYAPLDVPSWVQNFLNHWNPSGAIFVESELWPVRLKICQKRSIPTMLIGARISDTSLERWQYSAFLLKIVLNCFSWIAAKDNESSKRIQHFNCTTPQLSPFDLKLLKEPLLFNKQQSEVLKKKFRNKKIFLAASTHNGEEAFFFRAFEKIKNKEEWLFILAPRHSERAETLSKFLNNAPKRSRHEYPENTDNFWIIDTIGELGLFFSIADCAFIGGSLLPKGKGHNPYEALQFHLKTSVGPYRSNWEETYASLKKEVTTIATVHDFLCWLESNSNFSKKITMTSHKEELTKIALSIHETVLALR